MRENNNELSHKDYQDMNDINIGILVDISAKLKERKLKKTVTSEEDEINHTDSDGKIDTKRDEFKKTR